MRQAAIPALKDGACSAYFLVKCFAVKLLENVVSYMLICLA